LLEHHAIVPTARDAARCEQDFCRALLGGAFHQREICLGRRLDTNLAFGDHHFDLPAGLAPDRERGADRDDALRAGLDDEGSRGILGHIEVRFAAFELDQTFLAIQVHLDPGRGIESDLGAILQRDRSHAADRREVTFCLEAVEDMERHADHDENTGREHSPSPERLAPGWSVRCGSKLRGRGR
jgi:hypothetical protein